MNKWQDVQLADLVRFRNGKSTKGLEPGAYPVYGSNGIIGTGAQHMYENAIILGRVGAYCGSVEYCPGKFWATDNTIVVEPLEQHLDTAFAAYMFRLANLNRYAGGSAQPLLTQTNLKGLSFSVPPLETQRRIASILGEYDDLIEVNRRRIAVLEEMARGLFEEWFVRFRFPGHEAMTILDTPDGPLPEGWSWDRLGDVAAYVNRGIAPKYDDEVDTLVIGQKCIRDQRLSLVLARKQSKNVPSEKIVQPGDVLINSTGTGTLGRVAQAEQVPPGLTVDSHVTIVRPISSEDRDYLGLNLFAMQPVFEHLGAGSTNQTELARSAVQNQMLLWPPVDLRARFGRIVRPMRELVEQLAQHNASLAASRDLLLPRLISGQLSLAEATCELEEAA